MPVTDQDISLKCSLVGVDLERADLSGRDLRGVNLSCANLRGADLSMCNLTGATAIRADFSRANMHGVNLTDADISGSDLTGAYLKGALFLRTVAWATLMRRITAKNALFLASDFTRTDWAHAELLGARFDDSVMDQCRNLDTCQFFWWRNPWGGHYSMKPIPGWEKMDRSVLGGISFQENAARQDVWMKDDTG